MHTIQIWLSAERVGQKAGANGIMRKNRVAPFMDTWCVKGAQARNQARRRRLQPQSCAARRPLTQASRETPRAWHFKLCSKSEQRGDEVLDSSAIVPLCLDEPRSARLKRPAEEDRSLVVWWTALVECYSTFARLRREGIFSRTDEDHARRFVAQLLAEWTEIEPSNKGRYQAARVLLLHPLRAADSLQLAAALVWADGHPAGHELVCLDQKLRAAAQREGFTILPDSA